MKYQFIGLVLTWIGLFCYGFWRCIECYYKNLNKKLDYRQSKVKTNLNVYIARYNHVADELTRYRDLSWKIAALSWGIYYAIWRVCSVEKSKLSLPEDFLLPSFIITAILATAFLLNSEYLAHRLRWIRLKLERKMNMDRQVAHTLQSINLTRFPFILSILIFLFSIWMPPLAFLVKQIYLS